MALVKNAKDVLLHAWSVRLAILSAVFGAAEVALPFFDGLLPPKTMAALAVITSVGAAVARLIAQPKSMGVPYGVEPDQQN